MIDDQRVPSTAEIHAWIETVFRQGVRRPGHPADRWAESWAREQFESFGLQDVRLEPADLLGWHDRGASLRLWPEARPDEATDVACFALPHCTPGVLEGELAQLGGEGGVAGRLAVVELSLIRMPQVVMKWSATRVFDPDAELETLTQVLPFSPQFMAVMEPAIAADAAGFVGLLTGVPWETADYYVPYDAVERPIPGVWVSPANSSRIVELMRGGAVRARLVVDATRETVTCHNVVGSLRGRSDEWIIIGSHHDGPWSSAVEDASGISLVLAQARYWSQLPRSERPHNLLFLLNAGHMAGGAGCRAFIEAHRSLLPKVVAEIHLEHAARECIGRDGELVPTDAPEVRWWFTSLCEALEDIVEGAIVAEDLRRSLVVSPEIFGPHPTTDAGFFHSENVPLVNFLTAHKISSAGAPSGEAAADRCHHSPGTTVVRPRARGMVVGRHDMRAIRFRVEPCHTPDAAVWPGVAIRRPEGAQRGVGSAWALLLSFRMTARIQDSSDLAA